MCIIILLAVHIKVLIMNNSKSEKKENRLVTLKAQAEKFNFSMLRVSENNDKAHSGETMFLDFHRMNFIVNKKKYR
ncbi:hypothetical protein [Wolbachia endosymbiont of Armadillidium arcangelii]|uniref:Uncharacterized protein n=1 Tax=Wolbachia endosymbiont of Armadillidium arcangelii TaxID=3158571 RepID=A0AAU7Q445_9RICK